jgi:hypothetical protein
MEMTKFLLIALVLSTLFVLVTAYLLNQKYASKSKNWQSFDGYDVIKEAKEIINGTH